MRKSGSRIDEGKLGYEIIYFGNFSQAIASQCMIVRSKADLQDLRDKIDAILIQGDRANVSDE
jgi:hypothetical protein